MDRQSAAWPGLQGEVRPQHQRQTQPGALKKEKQDPSIRRRQLSGASKERIRSHRAEVRFSSSTFLRMGGGFTAHTYSQADSQAGGGEEG